MRYQRNTSDPSSLSTNMDDSALNLLSDLRYALTGQRRLGIDTLIWKVLLSSVTG